MTDDLDFVRVVREADEYVADELMQVELGKAGVELLNTMSNRVCSKGSGHTNVYRVS